MDIEREESKHQNSSTKLDTTFSKDKTTATITNVNCKQLGVAYFDSSNDTLCFFPQNRNQISNTTNTSISNSKTNVNILTMRDCFAKYCDNLYVWADSIKLISLHGSSTIVLTCTFNLSEETLIQVVSCTDSKLQLVETISARWQLSPFPSDLNWNAATQTLWISNVGRRYSLCCYRFKQQTLAARVSCLKIGGEYTLQSSSGIPNKICAQDITKSGRFIAALDQECKLTVLDSGNDQILSCYKLQHPCTDDEKKTCRFTAAEDKLVVVHQKSSSLDFLDMEKVDKIRSIEGIGRFSSMDSSKVDTNLIFMCGLSIDQTQPKLRIFDIRASKETSMNLKFEQSENLFAAHIQCSNFEESEILLTLPRAVSMIDLRAVDAAKCKLLFKSESDRSWLSSTFV